MNRYPARCGFTLIEIIATLLLISLAGVTVVTYMRAGLDRSADAPLNLLAVYDLSAQMADIEAQNTNTLAAFQTYLTDEGIPNQFVFFPTNAPHNVQVGGANLLRVILEDGEGRRLVTLFSEP